MVSVIMKAATNIGPKAGNEHPTGWFLNVPVFQQVIAVPDLRLIGDADVFGAFGPSFDGGFSAQLFLPLALLAFSLLLADFFDTMGTVVAVGAAGDLLDDRGHPPNVTRILMVDSLVRRLLRAGVVDPRLRG